MFHVGWFLNAGFGVYGWNEPWSGNVRADIAKPDLFVDLARSLERAGFDYMMIEDTPVLPDVYKGGYGHAVMKGVVRLDPMPLVPVIGQATSRIGIIVTVSTSFYPPFFAARLFNTLDHLTQGRFGANLVTSSPNAVAKNYGYDEIFEHDVRYAMADEWTRCVRALWDSWEADALVLDEQTGQFGDPERVHYANFEGKYFSSRGPLNTIPSPQGRPVIAQAGASPAGREFASMHADTIVSAAAGIEAMKAFRDDIAARMVRHGRDPSEVKILFQVAPVVGETEDDARDRWERRRLAQASDIDGNLAAMSYMSGVDFARFDPDEPFPAYDPNNLSGHRSTMADFQKAAEGGKTLREVARDRHLTESIDLVGTPDAIATQMEEAMNYTGGDGFLITLPVTRRNIAEITDGLAPALRRRGLIRSSYTYELLRDNLLEF